MLTLRKMNFCFCFVFAFYITAMLFMPDGSYSELKKMSEASMKRTHGQAGLTEFSMNNNTARLFLDLHIETYTTIGSFSAGNPSDFDLQFDTVSIGNSATDPLVIDGLVFMVDFDAASNLERVVIGTNRISGDITATMNQYSGVYNDALTGGSGSPVYLLSGAAVGTPGQTTFSFDSSVTDRGMFLVLTNDAGQVGFQLVSGYNENTVNTLTTGNWWDSP